MFVILLKRLRWITGILMTNQGARGQSGEGQSGQTNQGTDQSGDDQSGDGSMIEP